MPELPEGNTSRRTLLGGLMAVSVAGAAGLAAPLSANAAEEEPIGDEDVTNIDPADLDPALAVCGASVTAHSEIAGDDTYYEPTGAWSSFSYNSTFYNRLETWLNFWYTNTPLTWSRPLHVGSYGAYTNKGDGCVSYHNFGRAFDLSAISGILTTTGNRSKMFNARYDLWKNLTGSQLTGARRLYWATSASLHYHFKHVLTYLYNAQHHNHIHIDNAISGSGNSTFTTGASAQVQHVQACCTYIWGRPVTLDGVWGSQTSGAVSAVLSRIGRSGSLTTQANWLAFNQATLRFGTGAQSY
jgi:hypothetical protein